MVSRELGININQAIRELSLLESIGILKSEFIGNSKVYSVNEQCVGLKELKSLVKKDYIPEDDIKSAIAGLSGIKFALIFGSYASNKLKADSDIDLLIVGTPDLSKLNVIITELEKKLGREIEYFTYPLEEFTKKKSYGFLKNVVSGPKIMIIGDSDGLGRA
jgi:predicted nucleotidyltransferase